VTTGETVTAATLWARFDRWASALLMLFAIVEVAVSILVSSAMREPVLVAATMAAGLAAAATHLIAMYGLSVGRAWARPVGVTLLWLAVVVGLVQVVTALSSGSLYIPLGAIAAGLVLRMRPPDRPPWPQRHAPSVVVALLLVSLSFGLPSAAGYLLRPGNSALSVRPDSLVLTAGLACDESTGMPAEIRMTATWRWKEAEILAHGTDALAFRWQTSDPASDASISTRTFLLKDAPGTGVSLVGQHATNPGRERTTGPFWLEDTGSDNTDTVMSDLMTGLQAGDHLIRAPAREHHEGSAQTVMIDVDRQELRDGSFLIVLGSDPSVHLRGILKVDVAYVHGGRWIVWSDPVSCSL